MYCEGVHAHGEAGGVVGLVLATAGDDFAVVVDEEQVGDADLRERHAEWVDLCGPSNSSVVERPSQRTHPEAAAHRVTVGQMTGDVRVETELAEDAEGAGEAFEVEGQLLLLVVDCWQSASRCSAKNMIRTLRRAGHVEHACSFRLNSLVRGGLGRVAAVITRGDADLFKTSTLVTHDSISHNARRHSWSETGWRLQ
jgi:hypothetical protein